MGVDARGGITQLGASPNFMYAVKANMGGKAGELCELV